MSVITNVKIQSERPSQGYAKTTFNGWFATILLYSVSISSDRQRLTIIKLRGSNWVKPNRIQYLDLIPHPSPSPQGEGWPPIGGRGEGFIQAAS